MQKSQLLKYFYADNSDDYNARKLTLFYNMSIIHIFIVLTMCLFEIAVVL